MGTSGWLKWPSAGWLDFELIGKPYLAYVAAAASRWLMVRSIWAGGNSLRGVLRGAVQSAGDVDDPPRAPAHDFKGAGGDIAKGFASKC